MSERFRRVADGGFVFFTLSSSARLAFSLLAFNLVGCAQSPQPLALHLTKTPVAIDTHEIDYLTVDSEVFKATVYQPQGPGPFPVILDVHGGAWVREDVSRTEHAAMDIALAAMGIVVVAVDYRQSAKHHYPESVIDVNFAIRWLRANASRFNGSPRSVGVFGSSSGGHLVLLNVLRPSDSRYAALPLPMAASSSAVADYIILVYPISDPLARRAYAQERGNAAPVKSTDIYFSSPGSIEDGNPQLILDRQETVMLPPALLLQGSADANGFVKDTNVSPAIQERFARAYRAAGGNIQLQFLQGAPHNLVNEQGTYLDQAIGFMRPFIEEQLARH